MKKYCHYSYKLIVAFAAALALCGCDEGEEVKAPDIVIPVYDTSGDMLETQIAVIEEAEAEDNDRDRLKAEDMASKAADYVSEQNSYAYSTLTDKEKQTYVEILAVLRDRLEEVELTSRDTDEIDRVFKCVMLDHPEIFYAKGYSIGKYMLGDVIDKIVISGTYTYSSEEIRGKNMEMEAYISNVLQNAPQGDEYEQIKYVYEYLIENNVYDESAPNNQNILSVIENGATVCQGYAKMAQLLLNRMGIFCTLINGEATGTDEISEVVPGEREAHVWNIVRCNGQYYNMDATWGDAAFRMVDVEAGDTSEIPIIYEFLLVPDSFLAGTHTAEPIVPVPACTSMDDNYYVREGLYFNVYDELKIRSIIDKTYATGGSIVILKACNYEVYKEIEDHLINDREIFDFVSQDNIKYVQYPERNMLMVTL